MKKDQNSKKGTFFGMCIYGYPGFFWQKYDILSKSVKMWKITDFGPKSVSKSLDFLRLKGILKVAQIWSSFLKEIAKKVVKSAKNE